MTPPGDRVILLVILVVLVVLAVIVYRAWPAPIVR